MSDAARPLPPMPPAGPCGRSSLSHYCERVRGKLSPERFGHVMRVTDLAEAIARGNGFDEGEVRATCLAAILHDVAREEPAARLLELAPPESDVERAHPMALHGRAGRAVAESWGVTDERVLEAIAAHVHGPRPGDRVAMALYVADVSEPGRGVNDDVRALALVDLERAFRKALEVKVRYLTSRGKAVHPRTLQVHEELGQPT